MAIMQVQLQQLLLLPLLVVVLCSTIVTPSTASLYASTGCSRLGCNAAHSNSVPHAAPDDTASILWHRSNYSGVAASGCVSNGALAWCSTLHHAVQVSSSGVQRITPRVFMAPRPGMLPVTTYASQLILANASTTIESVLCCCSTQLH